MGTDAEVREVYDIPIVPAVPKELPQGPEPIPAFPTKTPEKTPVRKED